MRQPRLKDLSPEIRKAVKGRLKDFDLKMTDIRSIVETGKDACIFPKKGRCIYGIIKVVID